MQKTSNRSYFRHFRLWDWQDQDMPLHYGGVTLYVEEQPKDSHIEISISEAVCSKQDRFCKKIGRSIARQRALSKKHVTITALSDKSIVKRFIKQHAVNLNRTKYGIGLMERKVRRPYV